MSTSNEMNNSSIITSDEEGNQDFDIEGYIQKKTSHGFYILRYFKTSTHYLHYYQDKAHAEAEDNEASESFNICEMKSIQKESNQRFYISFINDKFKIELKASTERLVNEWVEILNAKKSLYSTTELLSELQQNEMNFVTETFRSLMKLSERDRNKYLLDRLDEIFQSGSEGLEVNQVRTSLLMRSQAAAVIEAAEDGLRTEPLRLMRAATNAMKDFQLICEDCLLEMNQRHPKIIVHCREFMQRYSDIIKGRITLELLYLPGVINKQYEQLDAKTLCTALELIRIINELSKFQFLPRDFIKNFNKSLFTEGQLISSLMNIAIRRMDAYFEGLLTISSNQRYKRFLEIEQILSDSLSVIEINIHDTSLLQTLLLKIITTELLNFSDHFNLLDFHEYDETSLIQHILVCEELPMIMKQCRIHVQSRSVTSTAAQTTAVLARSTSEASIDSQSSSLQISSIIIRNTTTATAAVVFEDPLTLIALPVDIIDCIQSACSGSARRAIIHAVEHMGISNAFLLDAVLDEKIAGWLGGQLLRVYVNNLEQWTSAFVRQLPSTYLRVVYIEVVRLIIHQYIQRLILFHCHNKRIKLSKRAVQQLQDDFLLIYNWIETHITHDEDAGPERRLIPILVLFLQCSEHHALQCYADGIQQFGIKYANHLYDLLRLLTKFRLDLTPKARKAIMGLCSEFLEQLLKVHETDHSLLVGIGVAASDARGYLDRSIFEILCPHAGVRHCTGAKWRIERLADPVSVRLSVAQLVSNTCDQARAMKKNITVTTPGRQSVAKASIDTTINSSTPIKEAVNNSQNSPPSLEASSSVPKHQTGTEAKGEKSTPPPVKPPPPPKPAKRFSTSTIASSVTDSGGRKPAPPPRPIRRATIATDADARRDAHRSERFSIDRDESSSSFDCKSNVESVQEPAVAEDRMGEETFSAETIDAKLSVEDPERNVEDEYIGTLSAARLSARLLSSENRDIIAVPLDDLTVERTSARIQNSSDANDVDHDASESTKEANSNESSDEHGRVGTMPSEQSTNAMPADRKKVLKTKEDVNEDDYFTDSDADISLPVDNLTIDAEHTNIKGDAPQLDEVEKEDSAPEQNVQCQQHDAKVVRSPNQVQRPSKMGKLILSRRIEVLCDIVTSADDISVVTTDPTRTSPPKKHVSITPDDTSTIVSKEENDAIFDSDEATVTVTASTINQMASEEKKTPPKPPRKPSKRASSIVAEKARMRINSISSKDADSECAANSDQSVTSTAKEDMILKNKCSVVATMFGTVGGDDISSTGKERTKSISDDAKQAESLSNAIISSENKVADVDCPSTGNTGNNKEHSLMADETTLPADQGNVTPIVENKPPRDDVRNKDEKASSISVEHTAIADNSSGAIPAKRQLLARMTKVDDVPASLSSTPTTGKGKESDAATSKPMPDTGAASKPRAPRRKKPTKRAMDLDHEDKSSDLLVVPIASDSNNGDCAAPIKQEKKSPSKSNFFGKIKGFISKSKNRGEKKEKTSISTTDTVHEQNKSEDQKSIISKAENYEDSAQDIQKTDSNQSGTGPAPIPATNPLALGVAAIAKQRALRAQQAQQVSTHSTSDVSKEVDHGLNNSKGQVINDITIVDNMAARRPPPKPQKRPSNANRSPTSAIETIDGKTEMENPVKAAASSRSNSITDHQVVDDNQSVSEASTATVHKVSAEERKKAFQKLLQNAQRNIIQPVVSEQP